MMEKILTPLLLSPLIRRAEEGIRRARKLTLDAILAATDSLSARRESIEGVADIRKTSFSHPRYGVSIP